MVPQLALFCVVGGENPQQVIFGIFAIIEHFDNLAIFM